MQPCYFDGTNWRAVSAGEARGLVDSGTVQLAEADYEKLFKLDPGASWDLPPSTVSLDDDSIDRLATAIAAKLTEQRQADPTARLRRYWANSRKAR